MTPRFFYDEPRPASIGDRLLAEAHVIDLKLMKNEAGNVTLLFEVKGNVGSELWLDEADESTDAEQEKSAAALGFARELLAAFAAAGRAGDA